MPAIWASSERPISVRTVWVDGVRHAILSPDDPLLHVHVRTRRRPQTSISKGKNYPSDFYKPDLNDLDECFVKLRVVREKHVLVDEQSSRITRRQSAPPCSKLLETRQNHMDNVLYFSKEDSENLNPAPRNEAPPKNARILPDFYCGISKDDDDVDGYPDTLGNPLSERVLQWLDLSGRVREYCRQELLDPVKRPDEEKSSLMKKKAPFKREGSDVVDRKKERISVQNYKLLTDSKTDSDDKTILKRRSAKKVDDMPVVRSYFAGKSKGDFRDCEEVPSVNGDELEGQTLWTPPARPQLHIFMPTLNRDEKHSSSIESFYD